MNAEPPEEPAHPLHRTIALCATAFLLISIAACGEYDEPTPRSNIGGPVVDEDRDQTMQPMLPAEAPCTIHVEGYGDIDIEEDYIPNVVACENGNAPMEALKAQAVQARGYIYYKLFVAGADSVVNSQADQVYDCTYTDASERHFEAARATRGQYLSWNGEVVAPFYVAGAHPANPGGDPVESACQGTGSDPTSTEHFVTYNLGQSECNIEMTSLGWTPASCHDNPQNRGCASQNGQSCLADRGWTYEEMMPFYYGEDIHIERAGGECGGPWEEPSEYDLFCADNDDGWHCFDETERVQCSGDESTAVDTCAYGCSDTACSSPPEESESGFCIDEADDDGWYCFNQRIRVECVDGEITSTESCNAGCDDDRCVTTGQAPRDEDDDDDDGNGDGDDDTAASLVTPSQGVAGGCNNVSGTNLPASVPAAFALLVLLLISFRTGGHRRRPVPE